MKKRQITLQQATRPTWHLTRYAFHEAGHAVVGHVLGRCIAEVSIVPDRDSGYKGYCLYNTFAEVWNGSVQWRAGSRHPDLITLAYAGTLALSRLCQQRGWNYERWRGCDRGDFVQIVQLSLEMCADEQERRTMQEDCLKQAQNILEQHWQAVEALAGALVTHGRVSGWKAHRLIQKTIDHSVADWRMETWNTYKHTVWH